MSKGIGVMLGWFGGSVFGILIAAPSLSDDVRRGFMLFCIAIFAGIALVFHSWGEFPPESCSETDMEAAQLRLATIAVVNAENDRLRTEIDRLSSKVTQIGQQYHQAMYRAESAAGHGDVAPKEAKEQSQ